MSNSQHTPGPWVAIFPESRRYHEGADITSYEVMTEKTRAQMREEGRDHYERRHEDVANVGIVSCHFWRDMKDEEAKANARLIAAAPELLEALIDVSNQARHSDYDWPVELSRAVSAAITKATGEQPK